MPSDVSESAVQALMAKLAEARRTAGLTMEQLSDLSGVDLGVISRAERCLRIPALASLLDLAKALHLDLPETLAGVLQPASSNPAKTASRKGAGASTRLTGKKPRLGG